MFIDAILAARVDENGKATPKRRVVRRMRGLGLNELVRGGGVRLFKNEVIRDDSPCRSGTLHTLDNAEWAAVE